MKRSSFMKSLRDDKWVKPFFKRYRVSFVLAIILGFASFVCAGALMFTSGYLITRAAEIPWTIMVIHFPTLFARIFGVGKPVFLYLERLTSHNWVLRMTSNLRSKLYDTVEKDAIFFKRHHRTGDILGLLTEDIGHIQNLYLRTIFPTVIGWLVYLFLVIAFGYFSLWFALVMLVLLAVIVLVIPLVSMLANAARQAKRKAARNELYSELADNVLGVSDWVFSGRNAEYTTKHARTQAEIRKIDQALDRSSRRRDLAIQVVFGVAVVLVLLWAGSYFGGTYGGDSVWIAAFVLGFLPLLDAFTPLPTAATETGIYTDSIERLNALPDSEERDEASTCEVTAPLTVQVKDVSFAYPESNRTVLDDLSITITQGEKIAVLGRSGSGKSTLASLVRGDLQPSAGSVAINGVATSSFGDDIARYIGVIQQQTYLFNQTLLDNLRLGNPKTSEEEVWEALDKVGLKEMVARLPKQLNTLVDEGGLRFSGGERHRIALARVLLQDTPIILLDEPMVGLDPVTEQALLDTLFRTTAGKTLIMITHHLQGVSKMDQVIFIEEGKLTMSGSPAGLEQTNAHYQRLLAFDKGL